MANIDIRHGDCLEVLRDLPDNSVDSVITDPPYGLSNTKPQQVADVLAAWVTGETEAVPATKGGFMGKDWDSFVPPPAVWEECLRVLKPGGHMAVFAGARTQDLMGLSIRLAGFEIRDTLGWIYGSGFPKSMDVGKAIDRSNGENRNRQLEFTEWMRSTGITVKQISEATGTATMGGHYLDTSSQPAIATADLFDKLRHLLPEVPERIERLVAERTGIEWTDYVKREVVGRAKGAQAESTGRYGAWGNDRGDGISEYNLTAPATSDAARWDGWGTALKPAIEPIILARKPLAGTVAQNVLEHGVGGLNIDACRVPGGPRTTHKDGNYTGSQANKAAYQPLGEGHYSEQPSGRFPANVLLDEHAATEMDKQSGIAKPKRARTGKRGGSSWHGMEGLGSPDKCGHWPEDTGGGASRFFPMFKYQPKAPKRERPVVEREDGTKIQHPTVKPLALMEWLVTLTTPPGGTVLDPFAGTGTTLQAARDKGFRAIGVEQDSDYIQLIETRLKNAEENLFTTTN